MGLVAALMTAGFGAWLRSVEASIERATNHQTENVERIARVEASTEGVSARLDRIEAKLDRLLEQRRK